MVELGALALYLALPVAIYAAISPIMGVITGKLQYVKSARYAVYANGVIVSISAFAMVVAFLTNRFDLAYVFDYSNTTQPIAYKIAALYGGQAGSLLFWAWMLAIYMVIVVYQNRRKNQELMPYVLFVTMSVMTFFLFVITVAPALFGLGASAKAFAKIFSMALLAATSITLIAISIAKLFRKLETKNYKEIMCISILILAIVFFATLALSAKSSPGSNPFETVASKYKADFIPKEGQGLNPLLQNYGMIFHPPFLYMGYVGFTIPFAFALAALITKNLGAVWITSTRKWTVWAWFSLGVGIVFGAQWAYMELGWGGYWAWDPVENASFIPWLTGTAFLHSIMIQEKKNMLKIWNMLLIIFTFALSLFGTFLVRSGILSSVHSFGESSLGGFFMGAIFMALPFSIFLLATRLDALKSENELDSILSREASFLINNLILVCSALVVLWGTVYPLVSEAVGLGKPTVKAPFYETILVPFALLLFLITAICPLIAWRRATRKNLIKNFAKPVTIAAVLGGVLVVVLGLGIDFRSKFILPSFLFAGLVGAVTIAYRNKESKLGSGLAIGTTSGLVLVLLSRQIDHPWAIGTFFLLTFVAATIVLEFYRGTRLRFQHDKEREGSVGFDPMDVWRVIRAFFTLIWKNKRRYGGYIIHTGVVLMFVGITASSTWKISKQVNLKQGQTTNIGRYKLVYNNIDSYAVYKNNIKSKKNIQKEILATTLDVYESVGNGQYSKGQVTAEKNWHPNPFKDEKENQPTTEVGLFWNLREDLYVILNGFDPKTTIASFKIFVNPLMVWMWIGGFIICFGTLIVMWPDALEKKRLAAKYGSGG